MSKKQVEVFTDGACSGNPGPGGWGAVLRYKQHEIELSGGESETTNNRRYKSAAEIKRDLYCHADDRFQICFGRNIKGMGKIMAEERLEKSGQKAGT